MIDNRPCDICSSRPARVVMLRRRRGNNDRTFVCLECAHERVHLYGTGGVDVEQIVEQLEDRALGDRGGASGCRLCGTTLAEIVADARPGCSMCYVRFASEIEPAVKHAQGRTIHTGKAPAR